MKPGRPKGFISTQRMDLAGQRFNMLTALSFDKIKNRKTYWLFKCDCGVIKSQEIQNVKTGGTKSCGCLRSKPRGKRDNSYLITHGLSRTRFYNIWKGIKQRCSDKNSTSYSHYGGRGILNFWPKVSMFKRDMYDSYLKHVEEYGEKDTTIDRIDSDGHYCKENCRWLTRKENSINRKNIFIVETKGKCLTLNEFSKQAGISPSTIKSRIKTGMTVEQAVGYRRSYNNAFGSKVSANELSKILGISRQRIYQRLKKGQSPEEILKYYGVDNINL